MTIQPTNDIAELFEQRCIEPSCSATYSIGERIYVCPRCGGLLDIEANDSYSPAADTLKSLWLSRKTSLAVSDISGVWRFRELLPFSAEIIPVSLREGNTPLYEAPAVLRTVRSIH